MVAGEGLQQQDSGGRRQRERKKKSHLCSGCFPVKPPAGGRGRGGGGGERQRGNRVSEEAGEQ